MDFTTEMTAPFDVVSEEPTAMLRWATSHKAYQPRLQQKWLIKNYTANTMTEEWRDVPFVIESENTNRT